MEKGYKMEPPDGCPSEVYDIMKQVIYWRIAKKIDLFDRLNNSSICYSFLFARTGVGFTAREETVVSRHKGEARTAQS